MTLFWLICAALLIVAILFVAVPLWRGISKNNSVERDAANLEILRDQIAEMDNDLKNGLLTPELHEQGKRELQARLLEEVGDTEGAEISSKPHPLKITASRIGGVAAAGIGRVVSEDWEPERPSSAGRSWRRRDRA